jgi:large subunit ribosomal protein L4e
MKTNIYSTDGKKLKEMELPSVFAEEYRPDLIKKAYLAVKSRTYQTYGADLLAGTRSSAECWGPGGGQSRIPRVKVGPHRAGRNAKGRRWRSKKRWFRRAADGAIVPSAVGGKRAHPPKAGKVLALKINKKEKAKALRSAIAATTDKEIVQSRGHKIESVKELPIVVDDKLESLSKAKDVLSSFKALGLDDELARTCVLKQRPGKGKVRGRKYKRKVGPLVVVTELKGIEKGAANVPGVEVVELNKLGVTNLAPGTAAGRLTVWSKAAVEAAKERYA